MSKPEHYSQLHLQPIGGVSRAGSSDRALTVLNPFTESPSLRSRWPPRLIWMRPTWLLK